MDMDLWCSRRADGRKSTSFKQREAVREAPGGNESEWEMLIEKQNTERQNKRSWERKSLVGGGICSCAWDNGRRGAIPLTDPNSPGCDDPRGDTEDQQHGARADGHEGFHDEARVEVDLVEGTYTTRRRVCE